MRKLVFLIPCFQKIRKKDYDLYTKKYDEEIVGYEKRISELDSKINIFKSEDKLDFNYVEDMMKKDLELQYKTESFKDKRRFIDKYINKIYLKRLDNEEYLLNFDMNIKSINSPSDQIAIYIGIISTSTLVISLIWSGWRLLDVKKTLNGVMLDTAKTTSLVFIILLGAALLTAAFRAFGGEDLVRDFLNSLPGGFWSKFIMVMLVIFILGFFLDFIEIAVVVVPIVAPILLADPSANITAVWLGVMIGLNIQTSFLTPPMAMSAYYLKGVQKKNVELMEIFAGIMPFLGIVIFAMFLMYMFPGIALWLPETLFAN